MPNRKKLGKILQIFAKILKEWPLRLTNQEFKKHDIEAENVISFGNVLQYLLI